jgi:hypothetical protein
MGFRKSSALCHKARALSIAIASHALKRNFFKHPYVYTFAGHTILKQAAGLVQPLVTVATHAAVCYAHPSYI